MRLSSPFPRDSGQVDIVEAEIFPNLYGRVIALLFLPVILLSLLELSLLFVTDKGILFYQHYFNNTNGIAATDLNNR